MSAGASPAAGGPDASTNTRARVSSSLAAVPGRLEGRKARSCWGYRRQDMGSKGRWGEDGIEREREPVCSISRGAALCLLRRTSSSCAFRCACPLIVDSKGCRGRALRYASCCRLVPQGDNLSALWCGKPRHGNMQLLSKQAIRTSAWCAWQGQV